MPKIPPSIRPQLEPRAPCVVCLFAFMSIANRTQADEPLSPNVGVWVRDEQAMWSYSTINKSRCRFSGSTDEVAECEESSKKEQLKLSERRAKLPDTIEIRNSGKALVGKLECTWNEVDIPYKSERLPYSKIKVEIRCEGYKKITVALAPVPTNAEMAFGNLVAPYVAKANANKAKAEIEEAIQESRLKDW